VKQEGVAQRRAECEGIYDAFNTQHVDLQERRNLKMNGTQTMRRAAVALLVAGLLAGATATGHQNAGAIAAAHAAAPSDSGPTTTISATVSPTPTGEADSQNGDGANGTTAGITATATPTDTTATQGDGAWGQNGEQGLSADNQQGDQQVGSHDAGNSDDGAVHDGQSGQSTVSSAQLTTEETNNVDAGQNAFIPVPTP